MPGGPVENMAYKSALVAVTTPESQWHPITNMYFLLMSIQAGCDSAGSHCSQLGSKLQVGFMSVCSTCLLTHVSRHVEKQLPRGQAKSHSTCKPSVGGMPCLLTLQQPPVRGKGLDSAYSDA